MTHLRRTEVLRALDRALIAALILLAVLLAGVQVAKASGEIIPSVGFTRPVHTDDNTAKFSGGLAVRGNLGPMFKAEIGAAYRNEERDAGLLDVRQWPVTASLWFAPIPMLYAGGGAGWYMTTLDYASSTGLKDETTSKFGVHLGGGLEVPLGPVAGLDLNGRYIFMDKVESKLPPNEFDPDFWSTSLGLAIKF